MAVAAARAKRAGAHLAQVLRQRQASVARKLEQQRVAVDRRGCLAEARAAARRRRVPRVEPLGAQQARHVVSQRAVAAKRVQVVHLAAGAVVVEAEGVRLRVQLELHRAGTARARGHAGSCHLHSREGARTGWTLMRQSQ